MISKKYRDIYDNFIRSYKEIHVNPWHEITEEELHVIVDDLITKNDVDDIYSFKHFIDYIIKRLSGKDDAHTRLQATDVLPINFRIFDNQIYVVFPKNLKGYRLLSINGVEINKIINELEEVITYGTDGKRKYELEKALFNSLVLFGLPSLKSGDSLEFQLVDDNGNLVKKVFEKGAKYLEEERFDIDEYYYGDNANFRIEGSSLIYNHSSVQMQFKDRIEESINKMRALDLSNVNTIIVDLRGNFGGNSSLNRMLIDFLSEQKDKRIIALTDYRIFSSGRFALRDLIDIGAITIGEGIGTPMNCYGDCRWVSIDGFDFSISSCYFHPIYRMAIRSFEEFNSKATPEFLEPVIFKPDFFVENSVDDFINDTDSVLEYAKSFDITIAPKSNIK